MSALAELRCSRALVVVERGRHVNNCVGGVASFATRLAPPDEKAAIIEDLTFVPAIVERADADAPRPVIELDIGGDSVWVWRDADVSLVTAVIGVLKKKRSA